MRSVRPGPESPTRTFEPSLPMTLNAPETAAFGSLRVSVTVAGFALVTLPEAGDAETPAGRPVMKIDHRPLA